MIVLHHELHNHCNPFVLMKKDLQISSAWGPLRPFLQNDIRLGAVRKDWPFSSPLQSDAPINHILLELIL